MRPNIGPVLVQFGVCGAICGGLVAHTLCDPFRSAIWWVLVVLTAGNAVACWRPFLAMRDRPASYELAGGAWALGASLSLVVTWRRGWTSVEPRVLAYLSLACLLVGIACFAAAGPKLKTGRP